MHNRTGTAHNSHASEPELAEISGDDDLMTAIENALAAPLREMSGFAELLGERTEGLLDDRHRRLLDHVGRGAERMRSTLDRLAVFAEAGATPRPIQLDMAKIVRRSAMAMGSRLHDNCVEIRVGELVPVTADPRGVRRIVDELLDNAVRFTGSGASVVEVTSRRNGAEWQLHVADDGPGIPKALHARALGLFDRAHPRSEHDSQGAGLAIVERIASAHGGDVTLAQRAEGGLAVTVSLPNNVVPIRA